MGVYIKSFLEVSFELLWIYGEDRRVEVSVGRYIGFFREYNIRRV